MVAVVPASVREGAGRRCGRRRARAAPGACHSRRHSTIGICACKGSPSEQSQGGKVARHSPSARVVAAGERPRRGQKSREGGEKRNRKGTARGAGRRLSERQRASEGCKLPGISRQACGGTLGRRERERERAIFGDKLAGALMSTSRTHQTAFQKRDRGKPKHAHPEGQRAVAP